MSKISEHIISLYNQLKDNENQQIDDVVIDEAIAVLNNTEPINSYSLFYILAAANLLNAAIKMEQHKSQLFYGLIKPKVSELADIYLKNPKLFENVSIYYDNKQKCIYFKVFEVIFSFHQIQESKLIKNVASNNEPILWTGIRLHRIAQNVFLYAKEQYYNLNSSNDSHRLINEVSIDSNIKSTGNSNLIHCPDCNNKISSSAQRCPFCGSDLGYPEKLLE